jgi:hypothetical protein
MSLEDILRLECSAFFIYQAVEGNIFAFYGATSFLHEILGLLYRKNAIICQEHGRRRRRTWLSLA